ncbi:hypothetical protein AMATHDRAFT_71982 [Amanita thiersii Skay4041]|uniref:N-acetyltransferase domain-containing protein n=1 Tax=Amanita thiersii Skay4041 TaxID=703135 RepID=A0A2A9NBP2_9AGAR|nr:hypothetical protein AMATHDRAFT_71982 [Amanita thiersii Skay4041]
MILSPFQRTRVTSNAVGLLLPYCLDVPSAEGLGLRRVVWQASVLNSKSVKVANRMRLRFRSSMGQSHST